MKKPIIKESWVMIALCFLMVCITFGFCSSPASLYTSAMTEALGISRSAFSLNESLRHITTATANLFFGFLIGKFGAKKLVCAGFASLILSTLLYSFANNVILIYLGGVFLGLGLSWTTTTMVGYVIHKWCKNNVGTIMGVVLAANGIGGAVAIQILSPVIYQEGNLFGFRNSFRIVALLLFAVAVIIAIFFKEKPKDGQAQTGSAGKKRRGRSWPGNSWSDTAKKAYFYVSLVCVFLIGIILYSVCGIAAPLMKDVGLDADFVAIILSMNSVALFCFKFFTGFLYDKTGLRISTSLCLIAGVVVVTLLSLLTDSPLGQGMAVAYGIFAAMAMPLETVMLPILTGDLFGEKEYNRILGIVVSVNYAGHAIGSPLMNLCFDVTGNYHLALYIGGGLLVTALIVMQFVISSANREHKKFEAK